MKELEVIVGEHRDIWRFEYWLWYFPHPNYDPVNNGRIHLIGNFQGVWLQKVNGYICDLSYLITCKYNHHKMVFF